MVKHSNLNSENKQDKG